MRWRVAIVLCLVLGVAAGGQVLGQTQIAFTGTNYASATMKLMPIDQAHFVLVGEQLGVETCDKALFNNMSTHFALIIYVDQGAQHLRGYGTYVDKAGDKFVVEIWDFPSGSGTSGKGKVLGGTGKFAGLEGTADFVTQQAGGWPEGTSRVICTESWKLTLKNPMLSTRAGGRPEGRLRGRRPSRPAAPFRTRPSPPASQRTCWPPGRPSSGSPTPCIRR